MTHNTCAVVRQDQPFAVGEARHLTCSTGHTFKGRFVRITQHDTNVDMVLGEVEVDGTRGICAIFNGYFDMFRRKHAHANGTFVLQVDNKDDVNIVVTYE